MIKLEVNRESRLRQVRSIKYCVSRFGEY